MKGLFVKDFRFSLQNKKIIAVFILIAVMLIAVQGAEGFPFIISYTTMGYGMLVLNTISLDEFDKSNVFLMTLPFSKNMYVIEKYLFALLCSLSGWLLSVIGCFIVQFDSMRDMLIPALVILVILTMFQLFMLPLQLKFGGNQGIVSIVFLACFVVIILAVKGIGEKGFSSQAEAEQWINQIFDKLGALPAVLPAGLTAAAWLICFAVSLVISMGIMKKKEY